MRRVLFVDDEPRILRGIENLLFEVWDRWEVVTATSGAEALVALEREPFDLLITDMRMPGMNGLELLKIVRDTYPNIVTCILSGHAEAELVVTAMVLSHRYLAKPTNAAELIGLLEQVDLILAMTDTTAVRKHLGKEVPARPELLLKLKRLLADGAGFNEIAECVESDAMVSARLLKVANSVFYRGVSPVHKVSMAVSRVGLDTLAAILAQVSVSQAFSGSKLDRLEAVHERLVVVGALSKRIAGDEAYADRAFLAGMLHAIGRLILISNCSTAPGHVATSLAEQIQAEEETFGVRHEQVGAQLLRLWGFELDVVATVASHRDLRAAVDAGPSALLATATASALADELAWPNSVKANNELLEPVFGAESLERWRSSIRSNQVAA